MLKWDNGATIFSGFGDGRVVFNMGKKIDYKSAYEAKKEAKGIYNESISQQCRKYCVARILKALAEIASMLEGYKIAGAYQIGHLFWHRCR